MRLADAKQAEVHIELVTASFVASGVPEGVHDLGRFLENLNNPALSRQIELHDATVRPLYDATLHAELDAPLLVRRDDIIFATFEGPHFARGVVKPAAVQVPVLLMAPPFQISGSLDIAPDADSTQALRAGMPSFFGVRFARVFDADGVQLGEGEQIIVNSSAVQMQSATRRHIEAAPVAAARRRGLEAVAEEEPAAQTTRAA
jgi:hypothetical protein